MEARKRSSAEPAHVSLSNEKPLVPIKCLCFDVVPSKNEFFEVFELKMVGIFKIPYYALSLWPPPKPSLE
jgi:hypothetical protein